MCLESLQSADSCNYNEKWGSGCGAVARAGLFQSTRVRIKPSAIFEKNIYLLLTVLKRKK